MLLCRQVPTEVFYEIPFKKKRYTKKHICYRLGLFFTSMVHSKIFKNVLLRNYLLSYFYRLTEKALENTEKNEENWIDLT